LKRSERSIHVGGFLLKTISPFLCSIFSYILFVFVFCFFTASGVRAESLVLNVEHGRMDAAIEKATLNQVMESVIRKTGIRVFIDPSLLNDRISVHFKDQNIEDALKKISGTQSYAMIFSPEKDASGNHILKAVRIYPKGGPDHQERYVSLNDHLLAGFKSSGPAFLTSQEVGDMLKRDEQASLSHVSQENSKRKNGKEMGNTPGSRSLIDEALYRAKKMQKFKELKAKTMNQKTQYETRTALQLQEEKSALQRIAFEYKRQESLKASLSRNMSH